MLNSRKKYWSDISSYAKDGLIDSTAHLANRYITAIGAIKSQ